MSARLDPATQDWMRDERVLRVISALGAAQGEARFVGGAVRNALLGEPVSDIDIATPLTPEAVTAALEAAGLEAVPTGIAHGTVTAIAGGKPFEITTLRRDVETFGRRAVIAFTLDWEEDARRRDFTMNALYADLEGTIYDYTGGLEDIGLRRVRFVGRARERIREDYLRILRLFRFHAWYGRGPLDAEALAAAQAEKAGLELLSGERIQKELLKLLSAKDPMGALEAMEKTGILAELLPAPRRLDRLGRVIEVQEANGLARDPVLRLASLLAEDRSLVAGVASRLRLSNHDRDRLVAGAVRDRRLRSGLAPSEARKILYWMGGKPFQDQLILQWADEKLETDDSRWRALLALAASYRRPKFPLDGEDVMALGIEEGPKIGALLRDLEAAWVDEGAVADRTELLRRLRDAARPRL